jgi:hypothetical protein
MKRLIAMLMAVTFGVVIFTAPMFADPGDETNTDGTSTTDTTAVWTDPSYPPPPPGYVGPWPPPGENTATDGDGDDEGGWVDPDV